MSEHTPGGESAGDVSTDSSGRPSANAGTSSDGSRRDFGAGGYQGGAGYTQQQLQAAAEAGISPADLPAVGHTIGETGGNFNRGVGDYAIWGGDKYGWVGQTEWGGIQAAENKAAQDKYTQAFNEAVQAYEAEKSRVAEANAAAEAQQQAAMEQAYQEAKAESDRQTAAYNAANAAAQAASIRTAQTPTLPETPQPVATYQPTEGDLANIAAGEMAAAGVPEAATPTALGGLAVDSEWAGYAMDMPAPSTTEIAIAQGSNTLAAQQAQIDEAVTNGFPTYLAAAAAGMGAPLVQGQAPSPQMVQTIADQYVAERLQPLLDNYNATLGEMHSLATMPPAPVNTGSFEYIRQHYETHDVELRPGDSPTLAVVPRSEFEAQVFRESGHFSELSTGEFVPVAQDLFALPAYGPAFGEGGSPIGGWATVPSTDGTNLRTQGLAEDKINNADAWSHFLEQALPTALEFMSVNVADIVSVTVTGKTLAELADEVDGPVGALAKVTARGAEIVTNPSLYLGPGGLTIPGLTAKETGLAFSAAALKPFAAEITGWTAASFASDYVRDQYNLPLLPGLIVDQLLQRVGGSAAGSLAEHFPEFQRSAAAQHLLNSIYPEVPAASHYMGIPAGRDSLGREVREAGARDAATPRTPAEMMSEIHSQAQEIARGGSEVKVNPPTEGATHVSAAEVEAALKQYAAVAPENHVQGVQKLAETYAMARNQGLIDQIPLNVPGTPNAALYRPTGAIGIDRWGPENIAKNPEAFLADARNVMANLAARTGGGNLEKLHASLAESNRIYNGIRERAGASMPEIKPSAATAAPKEGVDAPLPDWARENISNTVANADRLGLTEPIRALNSEGKTAREIVRELDIKSKTGAKTLKEADDFVRQVRSGVSAPAAPQARPSTVSLPDALSRATPNAGYRSGNYETGFKSDLDKAAYIIGNSSTKSARHEEYLAFVQQATGMTAQEAVAFGRDVRASVKAAASDAFNGGRRDGRIEIPESEVSRNLQVPSLPSTSRNLSEMAKAPPAPKSVKEAASNNANVIKDAQAASPEMPPNTLIGDLTPQQLAEQRILAAEKVREYAKAGEYESETSRAWSAYAANLLGEVRVREGPRPVEGPVRAAPKATDLEQLWVEMTDASPKGAEDLRKDWSANFKQDKISQVLAAARDKFWSFSELNKRGIDHASLNSEIKGFVDKDWHITNAGLSHVQQAIEEIAGNVHHRSISEKGGKTFDVDVKTGRINNLKDTPFFEEVVRNPGKFSLSKDQAHAIDVVRQHLETTLRIGQRAEGPSTEHAVKVDADLLPARHGEDGKWNRDTRLGERSTAKHQDFETNPLELIQRQMEFNLNRAHDAWRENVTRHLTEQTKSGQSLQRKIDVLEMQAKTLSKNTPQPIREDIQRNLSIARDNLSTFKKEAGKTFSQRTGGEPIPSWLRPVIEYNSVFTPMMATLDLSWFGNVPGMFGIAYRNPVAFARATGAALSHMFGPGGEAARTAWMEKNGSTLDTAIVRGMNWAGHNHLNEFSAASLERIPLVGKGVRLAESTFTEFGNHARFEMYKAASMAHGLNGKVLSDVQWRQLTSEINKASGIGSKPTDIERALMFAPRFFRAQMGIISDALTKNTVAGFEAKRTVGQMLVATSTMAYLLNNQMGLKNPASGEWDWADPTSGNFMTFHMGGRDWSLLGPWSGVARALSLTFLSPDIRDEGIAGGLQFNPKAGLEYLARSKASPALSRVFDLMTNTTDMGRTDLHLNPFSDDPEDIFNSAVALASQQLPIGLMDAAKNGLDFKAPQTWLSILGFKSYAMSASEERDIARSNAASQLYDIYRADPKFAGLDDAHLKAQAWYDSRNDKTYQEKREAVINEGVRRDQPWAKIQSNVLETQKGVQLEQSIADKKFNNEIGAKTAAYNASKNEINALKVEIANVFDSEKINGIDFAREDISKRIDAFNAEKRSISRDIEGVKKGTSTADPLKLTAAIKALEAKGVQDPSKYESRDKEINDLLADLYAQSTKLGLDRRTEINRTSPEVQKMYDRIDALRGRHEDDSYIEEMDDPKAGTRAYEVAVQRYAHDSSERQGRLQNLMLSTALHDPNYTSVLADLQKDDTGIKAAVLSGKPEAITNALNHGAERDRVSNLMVGLGAIYDKYREDNSLILPAADRAALDKEIDGYREALSTQDKVLFDEAVALNPRTHTELQAAYRVAQNATNPREGLFFGVDVRFAGNKPENSLLGAITVAQGQMPIPGMVNAGAASTVAQLADMAIKGDQQGAIRALAAISSSTGADPERLVSELRQAVRSEAVVRGIVQSGEKGQTDINDLLNPITNGAVYRALGSTPATTTTPLADAKLAPPPTTPLPAPTGTAFTMNGNGRTPTINAGDIIDIAGKYNVPAEQFARLMNHEGNGAHDTSEKNVQPARWGIVESTAKAYGVTDTRTMTPQQAYDIAGQYLQTAMEANKGDVSKAFATYFIGQRGVTDAVAAGGDWLKNADAFAKATGDRIGVNYGPNSVTKFLDYLGATPGKIAPSAGPSGPTPVGPDGRTVAQITGTSYKSDAERAFYFESRGLAIPDPNLVTTLMAAGRSGSATGKGVTNSSAPVNEDMPVPGESIPPIAPISQAPNAASLEMKYFQDGIEKAFFGKSVDAATGALLSFNDENLAISRTATYQYMWDKNLDTRAEFIKEANALYEANKNDLGVRLLAITDPIVHNALTSDGQAAGRDYIIAIDRILQATQDHKTIDPVQALGGYKDVIRDDFFRQPGLNAIPEVKQIQAQLETIRNDARITLINDHLRTIDSNLTLAKLDLRDNVLTQDQYNQRVAELEAQRSGVITDKSAMLQQRDAKIDELNTKLDAVGDQFRPPPPGDGIYQFLMDKGVVSRDEIAKTVQAYYDEHKEDPAVKNIGAFLSGRVGPTPQLQAWMDQRTASLKAAELAKPSSITARNDAQIAAQVKSELRAVFTAGSQVQPELSDEDIDIARLMNIRPTNPTAAGTYIVAGSLLLAIAGATDKDIPQPFDPGFTRARVGTSFAVRPVLPPGGGGPNSTRYALPNAATGGSASSSFSTTRYPTTTYPRTSFTSKFPSSTGGAGVGGAGGAGSSAGRVASWDEFRQAVQTITGSGRTADIFEKAAATGRAVTDPKATRELQMLFRTVHVGGASTFTEWLSALRQLYLPRLLLGTTATGGDAANREIRTRRSP